MQVDCGIGALCARARHVTSVEVDGVSPALVVCRVAFPQCRFLALIMYCIAGNVSWKNVFANFTDRLGFTKIFPANILLLYFALCLYIEGEVTRENFRTFVKFSPTRFSTCIMSNTHTHTHTHARTQNHTVSMYISSPFYSILCRCVQVGRGYLRQHTAVPQEGRHYPQCSGCAAEVPLPLQPPSEH